jgi:hypothetical protein
MTARRAGFRVYLATSDPGLSPAVVEMRSKLEAYGKSLACGHDPQHLAEILFRVYLADVPWWRRAWFRPASPDGCNANLVNTTFGTGASPQVNGYAAVLDLA